MSPSCAGSVDGHEDTGIVSSTEFSAEEEELFLRRLSEGYDLKHDDRYNLWLAEHESAKPTSHRTGNIAVLLMNVW